MKNINEKLGGEYRIIMEEKEKEIEKLKSELKSLREKAQFLRKEMMELKSERKFRFWEYDKTEASLIQMTMLIQQTEDELDTLKSDILKLWRYCHDQSGSDVDTNIYLDYYDINFYDEIKKGGIKCKKL